jgi:hypothetical protein
VWIESTGRDGIASVGGTTAVLVIREIRFHGGTHSGIQKACRPCWSQYDTNYFKEETSPLLGPLLAEIILEICTLGPVLSGSSSSSFLRSAAFLPVPAILLSPGINMSFNATQEVHPDWLNAGDNAWQLTAGALVELQSIPGLVVLYAGLVKTKWAVNSAFMCFYAFAAVLVCWVSRPLVSIAKPQCVNPDPRGFVSNL